MRRLASLNRVKRARSAAASLSQFTSPSLPISPPFNPTAQSLPPSTCRDTPCGCPPADAMNQKRCPPRIKKMLPFSVLLRVSPRTKKRFPRPRQFTENEKLTTKNCPSAVPPFRQPESHEITVQTIPQTDTKLVQKTLFCHPAVMKRLLSCLADVDPA